MFGLIVVLMLGKRRRRCTSAEAEIFTHVPCLLWYCHLLVPTRTHLYMSEVKHLLVMCLAQRHIIETQRCPNIYQITR